MNKIVNMLNEIKPEMDFTQSADFIEDGMLDSFDVISLVSMIEEEYNITIDGMDILPENFNTVEAICALIEKNGGSIDK